jgi:hypothetical protein
MRKSLTNAASEASSWLSCATSRIAGSVQGDETMRAILGVRFVVVGAALCAAVACGGSTRVDSGGPSAAGASAAGASSGAPGLAQGGQAAGDLEPISAGSPSMPSGGSGAGGVDNGAQAGGGQAGHGEAGGGHGGDWCMLGGVQYSSTPTKCDCNTCWCDSDGRVVSTLVACYPCSYGGQTYPRGVSFPDRDGCNTCACPTQDTATVTCTRLADCSCNPDKEWYRKYTATSVAACAAAKFACPDNTTSFFNDCGCGCEEQESCGQYVDCQPGPNAVTCEAQKAACPYAQVTE